MSIDLLPNIEIDYSNGEKLVKTILSKYICKNIVKTFLLPYSGLAEKQARQLSKQDKDNINNIFSSWQFKPAGTEGYRTAEVTIGGVNVNHISSKTMEVKNIKGLFFIGEVLDVTGWLGGYNFQWAWSSGWVAGQYV